MAKPCSTRDLTSSQGLSLIMRVAHTFQWVG
jgi:hypothetical protein